MDGEGESDLHQLASLEAAASTAVECFRLQHMVLDLDLVTPTVTHCSTFSFLLLLLPRAFPNIRSLKLHILPGLTYYSPPAEQSQHWDPELVPAISPELVQRCKARQLAEAATVAAVANATVRLQSQRQLTICNVPDIWQHAESFRRICDYYVKDSAVSVSLLQERQLKQLLM